MHDLDRTQMEWESEAYEAAGLGEAEIFGETVGEAFEAGLLRQERVKRAEPARHRRHLLALQNRPESPAILADPIAPVLRHSLHPKP